MKKQQDSPPIASSGMLTPEFDPKDPISDAEREIRIAAFHMSPVWKSYQHYNYMHETGYRNTFPPPSPHVAFSLGRAHIDYSEPLSSDSVVHCPMPIKASSLPLSHIPSREEQTDIHGPYTPSFSQPQSFQSFQSFQPRPKSQDFSSNFALSPLITPTIPLSTELQSKKRPRDSDALERLKADFLAASPSSFARTGDRWRVTLPPIASFPTNTPIHDVVCIWQQNHL